MEIKNLAYQKRTFISPTAPIEHSYKTVEKGTKDMLTDGALGNPASCYGGEWAHFYRGVGRTVTIDLEGFFAVSGFNVGFIHDKNMGIYCPERVRFMLSEDGLDYYEVASALAPYPASFGMQVRAVYSASFEKPIRARFARISFDVEVNSFCDEIAVLGNSDFENTASLYGEPVREINKNCFAARDSLGGAHDIPLIYFGYWPEDERVAKIRKDDFIPYIAYIDRDGNPIDTMFDAILMLAVQGRCPSGGSLGYHGAPSKLSDWEFILDELFADGQNIKALDQAVAEVKQKLGLPKDYRHKLYLTAPVPKVSLEPFGDLNGDGIEEKLLSTDDCVNAYAAFVDITTRRFEAEHFENIILDGWFWNNESASRASRDDEEYFATECMKKLKERGYKAIFIPYFQAGGCEKADKIGFDCTTMQPGLSFQEVLGREPQEMMQDFTELCKKYGFGVELEIHQGVKNPDTREKYAKLFDEYLIACMRNGMMTDTVHTYYQVAGPGVFYYCAVSEEESMRVIYDKLYKFIKGTLTEEDFLPPAPKTLEYLVEDDAEAALEEIIDDITASSAEASEEITESVKDCERACEEMTSSSEFASCAVEEDKSGDFDTSDAEFDNDEELTFPFLDENGNEEISEEESTCDENGCAIIFDDDISVHDGSFAESPEEKTEKIPENERKKAIDEGKKKLERFVKNNKKKLALGVGLAAAVGAALVIIKAITDKDD